MATTATTTVCMTSELINDRQILGPANSSQLKFSGLRPLPLAEGPDVVEEIHAETSNVESTNLEKTLTSSSSSSSSSIIDGGNAASTQKVLLLQAIKEKYTLVANHAVPSIFHPDEILVKVLAVGLNPIDWKGPAYNFGIPDLPWIFGRDFAGIVVKCHSSSAQSSRLQVGDRVLVPSTDYRDIRKAAFQQYAVTTHYNAARIPPTISVYSGASIGVAYVAAALALGVSFGLDFGHSKNAPGPNLRQILKEKVDVEDLAEDVRGECLPSSTVEAARVQRGDWITIWGGSTTTGYIALQLAKLCGLKVICIADIARHGNKLHAAGADILVDRYDTHRAVEIIRGVTNSQLRFAMDIVGRETATVLEKALKISAEKDDREQFSHLLGLTGLPKMRDPGIVYHTVPIKIFHTCAEIGGQLISWLERLLETKALVPPEIMLENDGGLEGVNQALDKLRSGTVSGKRIVIDMNEDDTPPSHIG